MITAVLIGIVSYYLVKLIDFSFNKDNILDFYYVFLLENKDKYPKLTKVLGLCIKCFGVWFTILTYLLFYFNHDILFVNILISISVFWMLITYK